jgi:hypothetical protein
MISLNFCDTRLSRSSNLHWKEKWSTKLQRQNTFLGGIYLSNEQRIHNYLHLQVQVLLVQYYSNSLSNFHFDTPYLHLCYSTLNPVFFLFNVYLAILRKCNGLSGFILINVSLVRMRILIWIHLLNTVAYLGNVSTISALLRTQWFPPC